ncbi:hypothetical protein PYCC9005_000490 [Savitreella phatthalungensis]
MKVDAFGYELSIRKLPKNQRKSVLQPYDKPSNKSNNKPSHKLDHTTLEPIFQQLEVKAHELRRSEALMVLASTGSNTVKDAEKQIRQVLSRQTSVHSNNNGKNNGAAGLERMSLTQELADLEARIEAFLSDAPFKDIPTPLSLVSEADMRKPDLPERPVVGWARDERIKTMQPPLISPGAEQYLEVQEHLKRSLTQSRRLREYLLTEVSSPSRSIPICKEENAIEKVGTPPLIIRRTKPQAVPRIATSDEREKREDSQHSARISRSLSASSSPVKLTSIASIPKRSATTKSTRRVAINAAIRPQRASIDCDFNAATIDKPLPEMPSKSSIKAKEAQGSPSSSTDPPCAEPEKVDDAIPILSPVTEERDSPRLPQIPRPGTILIPGLPRSGVRLSRVLGTGSVVGQPPMMRLDSTASAMTDSSVGSAVRAELRTARLSTYVTHIPPARRQAPNAPLPIPPTHQLPIVPVARKAVGRDVFQPIQPTYDSLSAARFNAVKGVSHQIMPDAPLA